MFFLPQKQQEALKSEGGALAWLARADPEKIEASICWRSEKVSVSRIRLYFEITCALKCCEYVYTVYISYIIFNTDNIYILYNMYFFEIFDT